MTHETERKSTRGGYRPGGGRPRKPETATYSIRHDAGVIRRLKQKFKRGELQRLAKKWLDSLL